MNPLQYNFHRHCGRSPEFASAKVTTRIFVEKFIVYFSGIYTIHDLL